MRRIVGLALDGYGDQRLVKKLNDEKWPVISDHPHWTMAYVSKILKSVALIGQYQPGMEKNGKRVLTGETFGRLSAADYRGRMVSTQGR